MNKTKTIQIFRIILSILFIFSAITKLLSLAFFDALIADLFIEGSKFDHPTAYWFTQVLSRIIISGELLLGAALLQEKYFKKLILPTTAILLIGFTLQLVYAAFTQETGIYDGFFSGNCGCFGDILPMNNFESILKNVISLGMVGYCWKFHTIHTEKRFRSWIIPITIGLVTFLTLLLTVKILKKVEPIVYPLIQEERIETSITKSDSILIDTVEDVAKTDSPQTSTKITIEEKIIKKTPPIPKKIKTIFSPYTYFETLQKQSDLDVGHKMICLFSATCSHCQQAYKDICELDASGKLPNVHLILFGTTFDVDYFFNQAGCKHPYVLIENYEEFELLLEGKHFPRVVDRKEGMNIQDWDIASYSKENLMNYYGIKEKKKEGIELQTNPEDDLLGF